MASVKCEVVTEKLGCYLQYTVFGFMRYNTKNRHHCLLR